MLKSSFLSAIFLMAGKGNRFGSPIAKQFHTVGDKPLYQWALSTLMNSSLFDEIILVCAGEELERVKHELPHSSIPLQIVEGGSSRQESSFLGLSACSSQTEFVLIHDAARPFLSEKILQEHLSSVEKYKAVNTCIPATDTIIRSLDGTTIQNIPERKTFFLGQTPQSFSFPLIWEAHIQAKKENRRVTCDCSLVQENHPVHIVQGSPYNFKITTSFDLEVAKGMAKTSFHSVAD